MLLHEPKHAHAGRCPFCSCRIMSKVNVTSKALGEDAVASIKEQAIAEVKEQLTNLKNEALEKALPRKHDS